MELSRYKSNGRLRSLPRFYIVIKFLPSHVFFILSALEKLQAFAIASIAPFSKLIVC